MAGAAKLTIKNAKKVAKARVMIRPPPLFAAIIATQSRAKRKRAISTAAGSIAATTPMVDLDPLPAIGLAQRAAGPADDQRRC